jgi:hypothetical protein
LYSIADKIELAVADTSGFIEQLNETGDLLKKGGGRYSYNAGTLRLKKVTSAIGPPQQQQHTQHHAQGDQRYTIYYDNNQQQPQWQEQQGQEQRGAVAGKRGAPSQEPTDDGFDW